LSSSSDTTFTFKLGPNLKNAGITSWILDQNTNEFSIAFNSEINAPVLKIPYNGLENIKINLNAIATGIANALHKDIKDPNIKSTLLDIKNGYLQFQYSKLGAIKSSPSSEESESESNENNLTREGNETRKRKGRGRRSNKDKQEKVLSPIEEQDKKDKERYLKEVLELKNKFEAQGLTYKSWQQLVKQTYFDLRKITKETIPDAWDILELCLALKGILHIKNNTLPFQCIVLGPPSSNKTTILELFRKHHRTYYTDSLGPHAFVSHNTSYAEDQLQQVDIVPKMKDNLVLVSEMAPIFTTKEDDMRATIGVMTRLADGHGYAGNTGAHGKRGYGYTMYCFVGAAVNIPERVWEAMRIFGFKIYFLRHEVNKLKLTDLKKRIYDEPFKIKREKIEQALSKYLKIFDAAPNCPEMSRLYNDESHHVLINWITPGPQAQITAYEHLTEAAYLLSFLRTKVDVQINKKRYGENDDTESSIDYTVDKPEAESPTRAQDIFTNIAAGHAISQGRDTFDERDIAITINIGLSSTTEERAKLIRLLIKHGGHLTATQICFELNFSKPTARRHIREFITTGIAASTEGTSHKSMSMTFEWFLSEEYSDIISGKREAELEAKETSLVYTNVYSTETIQDIETRNINYNSSNDWC
jgi:hypothetical protein